MGLVSIPLGVCKVSPRLVPEIIRGAFEYCMCLFFSAFVDNLFFFSESGCAFIDCVV